eukprot:14575675-Ditylum_brightwellii.AAC.1
MESLMVKFSCDPFPRKYQWDLASSASPAPIPSLIAYKCEFPGAPVGIPLCRGHNQVSCSDDLRSPGLICKGS